MPQTNLDKFKWWSQRDGHKHVLEDGFMPSSFKPKPTNPSSVPPEPSTSKWRIVQAFLNFNVQSDPYSTTPKIDYAGSGNLVNETLSSPSSVLSGFASNRSTSYSNKVSNAPNYSNPPPAYQTPRRESYTPSSSYQTPIRKDSFPRNEMQTRGRAHSESSVPTLSRQFANTSISFEDQDDAPEQLQSSQDDLDLINSLDEMPSIVSSEPLVLSTTIRSGPPRPHSGDWATPIQRASTPVSLKRLRENDADVAKSYENMSLGDMYRLKREYTTKHYDIMVSYITYFQLNGQDGSSALAGFKDKHMEMRRQLSELDVAIQKRTSGEDRTSPPVASPAYSYPTYTTPNRGSFNSPVNEIAPHTPYSAVRDEEQDKGTSSLLDDCSFFDDDFEENQPESNRQSNYFSDRSLDRSLDRSRSVLLLDKSITSISDSEEMTMYPDSFNEDVSESSHDRNVSNSIDITNDDLDEDALEYLADYPMQSEASTYRNHSNSNYYTNNGNSSFEREADRRNSDSFCSPRSKPTSNSPWARETFAWSEAVRSALTSIFGLRKFRENQLEIINTTMAGKDVFVLMPTGGGKSLTYQLPAVCSTGLTVVVSPLIALIQDQVQQLRYLGIETEFLGSGSDETHTYREILKRNSSVRILYITPEKISKSQFLQDRLKQLHQQNRLSRIAIDEAHCVSQWGRGFRPDYKACNIFKQLFPDVPVIALTATATDRVRTDVIYQLGLRDHETFKTSFNRMNLSYEVRPKQQTTKSLICLINDMFPQECGVVYCLSKRECESVAESLQEAGIKADFYHADLPVEDRERVQQDWTMDRTHVICATIAFGMGINKPDVRFVVHYSLPKSLEGYYQESGRAGRDGASAKCILYYSYKDKQRLERLLRSGDVRTAEQRRELESNLNCLRDVVNYATNETDCRRKILLQYLGENFNPNLCNNTCDNCQKKDKTDVQKKDVTIVAQNIINILRQCKATTIQISKVLRGHKEKDLILGRSNDTLPEYNSLPEYFKPGDLERLITEMVSKRYLSEMIVTTRFAPISYLVSGPEANRLRKIVLTFVQKKKGLAPESTEEERKLRQNRDLKVKLLQLRHTISTEQPGLSPYLVMETHFVTEMAERRPETENELYDLGIPKYKVQRHGKRFLTAIREYVRGEGSRSLDVHTTPSRSVREKTPKKAGTKRKSSTTSKSKKSKKPSTFSKSGRSNSSSKGSKQPRSFSKSNANSSSSSANTGKRKSPSSGFGSKQTSNSSSSRVKAASLKKHKSNSSFGDVLSEFNYQG